MLTHSIAFVPEEDAAAFAALPTVAGAFRLCGHDGRAEPYVSKAANLRRRIQRLLAPPESHSKRLNLRDKCGRIEWTAAGSDFEAILLLYRELREAFPETYARRLRLTPSALVRIHWENAYPRAYVTRRLGTLHRRSIYYGPFASRAEAERYLNDVLDLFKSRRCHFELHPDPQFPGCVYSEMKMCLAPCFQGCTDAEYLAETERVQAFLDSRGDSLRREGEAEREQASAALAFEQAAAAHARVEKVKTISRLPAELTRRLDQMDALVVLPALAAGEATLLRFSDRGWAGPVAVRPGEPGELAAAAEGLRGERGCPVGEWGEQLAILRRWYFRSHRTGEIFFRNEEGQWPARRIMNAVARLTAAGPSGSVA